MRKLLFMPTILAIIFIAELFIYSNPIQNAVIHITSNSPANYRDFPPPPGTSYILEIGKLIIELHRTESGGTLYSPIEIIFKKKDINPIAVKVEMNYAQNKVFSMSLCQPACRSSSAMIAPSFG